MNKYLKNFVTLCNYLKINEVALDAVNKVLAAFKKTNRVGVVLPTGGGKTAVACAIVAAGNYPDIEQSYQREVLFVTPQDTLIEQTKSKLKMNGLEKKVHIMTYSMITAKIKSGDIEFFNNFKFIILDELHRSGATGWNKNLNIIFENNKEAKLLGLTATEKRYLDACRDMTEEWGMTVAKHMTIVDAWEGFFMKAPTYIVVDENIVETVETLISKCGDSNNSKVITTKDKLKSLIHNLKEDNGIIPLFKTYFYNNNINKVAVFYDNTSDTQKVKESMEYYFKGAGYKSIKFFIANCEVGKKRSAEQVKLFSQDNESDDLWVMLSINMLNEGLHVDGCYAEIQYRHTLSRNLFLQQSGRVMSTDLNKPKPIIMDFVNNIFDSATKSDVNGYIDEMQNITKKPEDFSEQEIQTLMEKGCSPEDFCLCVVESTVVNAMNIFRECQRELEVLSNEELQRKVSELYQSIMIEGKNLGE